MNKKQIKEAISTENKRHDAAIKDLYSKLRVIEMQEEAKARTAYQNRKDLLDGTGEWLNKNNILKIGDIVKVIGSRAGAYRRVTAIQYFTIIGQVVNEVRVKKEDGGYSKEWVFSGTKITSQGMNKITHIMRDGVFVHVKDLKDTVDIATR